MNKLLRLIGLLSVVIVAACSSTSEQDKLLEPLELEAFVKQAKLKALWSKDLGRGQSDNFSSLRPAVFGQSLFAADSGGSVYKLDKTSGERIWRTKLDEEIVSGVGLGDNTVYVGLAQGLLVSLNADTGAENWRVPLNAEILAPAADSRGVVVVQTATGIAYGLRTDNGAEIWRYNSVAPRLTLRGTAAPTIVESIVFLGFANGKVVALDINSGLERWSSRLASATGDSEIERITDVDATPLVVGGNIIAGSVNGSIAMLDAASGQPYWRKDASVFGDVSEGFGNVYFASKQGELNAFEITSGQIKWINESLLRRNLGHTATWINYVVVADYKGYMHVISQVDGRVVARKRVDEDYPRAPFLVNERVLYVLNNAGKLSAFTVTAVE